VVAVNKLNKKLFRDLLAARAQYAAVAAIIAIGITAFVGVYESYQNLYLSCEHSYELLSMGDYWITVDYLPARATREMDSIPGVRAEGRLIGTAKVDLSLEGGTRVEARIVSMPAGRRPGINDVELEEGEYFSPGNNREIILDRRFADFHGLSPGDRLTLEHGGAKAAFLIVGIAVSPEFIWISKSAQEPVSTPGTFSVMFMPYPAAEEFLGLRGMVNEISLVLADDASEAAALAAVQETLRSHGIKRISTKNDRISAAARKIDIVQGVRTAYVLPRADQLSYAMLRLELDGLRQMAVLFPMLFLGLAALAVYVLLNRLVESQRVQIGLMRALGYGKLPVLGHYIGFALVVGICGSGVGALLGHLFAGWLTAYYITFFHVPYIQIQSQWAIVAIGVIVGTTVPVSAGVLPAWATSRMQPANAMRPPAPPVGRRTLVETLLPFFPRLPSTFKLPLRNISRNLRRTLFMATGVMSATALVLVSLSFVDMMDYLFVVFEQGPRYDARVIFQGVGSAATANFIAHLDEVESAEPVLEQPFRLQLRDEVLDAAVMGLQPATEMYRFQLEDGSIALMPDDGLLLSTPVRNRLKAEVGDVVHLEPYIGTVGATDLPVVGIVDEPLGGRAYLSLSRAQELFSLPGAASGAFVRFYGEPGIETLQRIYSIPEVASIESSAALLDFYNQQTSFFWAFVGVMLAMSFGLGIAIVFNGVTVNVLERRREIAVMRAVGMGDRRLAAIITIENLGVAALGILIGLPAGYRIATAFMAQAAADAEGMAFTTVIYPRSYVLAAICSVLIMLLSQLPAIRQMTRMSLPTVTKGWAD